MLFLTNIIVSHFKTKNKTKNHYKCVQYRSSSDKALFYNGNYIQGFYILTAKLWILEKNCWIKHWKPQNFIKLWLKNTEHDMGASMG